MNLIGQQDLDERIAAIRAEVQADMADREALAEDAAADAVKGPLVLLTGVKGWLTGPVTPAFEGRARVVALVACGLPVLAIIVALILAS